MRLISLPRPGVIPVVLLIAAFGLLLFFAITLFAPFKDQLWQALFPKPKSEAASASAQGILIGTSYTHYSINNCSLSGGGIIANYDKSGVQSTVQKQLATMRSNGIQMLGLAVWHMTDTSGQDWGIIPSAGGGLANPYWNNLKNYLTDVKNAGFVRLDVTFSPQWTNDPLCSSKDTITDPNDQCYNKAGAYDPSKFAENWSFIQSVRSLIKTYGPEQTRIVPLNEGAPSDYWHPNAIEQLKKYIADMYTLYVNTYGKSDMTVSFIADRTPDDTNGHRFQNLINIFKSTGLGQPDWFEAHIGYTGDKAYFGLKQADEVLKQNGLSQPIIIGETAYNDADAAQGILNFVNGSNRRIQAVRQWPLKNNSTCKDISESPPYVANAYISALQKPQGTGKLSCSINPAKIQASWNNIASGTTGSGAQVCVSMDGTKSKLMSSDGGKSGSLSDSPSWIQAGHKYTFTLHDQYGGDFPDCEGVILSTCDVSTSAAISCTPSFFAGLNSGLGTSNISANYQNFNSGNPSADVCVSNNNGPYVLFAAGGGPSGSINQSAPWIGSNNTYKFSLFKLPSNSSPRCTGEEVNSCTVKSY